jgi:hypothetical protein
VNTNSSAQVDFGNRATSFQEVLGFHEVLRDVELQQLHQPFVCCVPSSGEARFARTIC